MTSIENVSVWHLSLLGPDGGLFQMALTLWIWELHLFSEAHICKVLQTFVSFLLNSNTNAHL